MVWEDIYQTPGAFGKPANPLHGVLGVGNDRTLGPELCLRAENENNLHFKVTKEASEF